MKKHFITIISSFFIIAMFTTSCKTEITQTNNQVIPPQPTPELEGPINTIQEMLEYRAKTAYDNAFNYLKTESITKDNCAITFTHDNNKTIKEILLRAYVEKPTLKDGKKTFSRITRFIKETDFTVDKLLKNKFIINNSVDVPIFINNESMTVSTEDVNAYQTVIDYFLQENNIPSNDVFNKIVKKSVNTSSNTTSYSIIIDTYTKNYIWKYKVQSNTSMEDIVNNIKSNHISVDKKIKDYGVSLKKDAQDKEFPTQA